MFGSFKIGSPVNRLNIMAHHASSGLLRDPPPPPPPASSTSASLPINIKPTTISTVAVVRPLQPATAKEAIQTYLSSRLTFLRFRTALFAIDAAFYFTNFASWWVLTRRRVSELVWGRDANAADQNGRRGGFEDLTISWSDI